MATTGERNTEMRQGDIFSHTLAVAAKINKGALVVLDAGLAKAGLTDADVTTVGMATQTVDQAAGDTDVLVRTGTFLYANSAAADEITSADIGANCYLVDDETVAKTDDEASRSVAGRVRAVEAGGVWITI